MSAPVVFDVCGPLPDGTTVLEASAGTGKTFTIAALATRYVAEGVADLSELMLVTFGRHATSELRDRVRERLVGAERALRDPCARTSVDALVAHLADVDDAELARRRERLTRALADFDAATIATTHGFCQQMLASLGVTGDVDSDAVLVPDISDLVDEVVDDLYLQRYASQQHPVLDAKDARTVARDAVSDHQASLEPHDTDGDSVPGHRYAFASAVRAEVLRRKRARRLLDYDDLLVLLRDAVAHPQHGAAAAERVRSHYRVVMVDEFQDTDPVQWEILRLAFHGHRTLVLIGDPKQAIYAFRGADVVTYLHAASDATAHATLGRSWRSDEPLLQGLAHVLGGAALGDERIVVHPVDAAHAGRRVDGAGAPVRVRQVTRPALGLAKHAKPSVEACRALIAGDVAADVVRQLEGTRVLDDGEWRGLRPGDVAVLTRTNAEAARVRLALVAAGVPAVESGLSSVFATSAARHWLTLLTALEQPGHSGRAGALALTPFVGWDGARLAGATDTARDELSDRVRAWAQVLTGRGVAALTETVMATGVAERLLRTSSGERMLTDLRHVGQSLHAAGAAGDLGSSALVDWLRRRMDEASRDYAEERSRRLETDAAAVQVVTVHASKGLEFGVVYVPFAWDRWESNDQETLRFHDDDERRVLHVGGRDSADYASARERHLEAERAEELRLLYVALTRARSQVVTWWAPTNRNTRSGALTRLLLGGHGPGQVPPQAVSTTKDDEVHAALTARAAGSGGTVVVEQVTTAPRPARWEQPLREPEDLHVGRFTRHLDLTWRRTSYTGLTAAAHAEHETRGVASEPETTGVQDEPDETAPATYTTGTPDSTGATDSTGAMDSTGTTGTAAAPGGGDQESALLAVPSPMADLPGGAAFGTLVHQVLEHVDTSAADLDAELLGRAREALRSRVLGVVAEDLASALVPVLATPMGPLAGDRALREVPTSDRLSELEFELPLAGGDSPQQTSATLADLARLLRSHLPTDDPFARYADELESPLLRGERLRGYLTGSIDAVLRVRDETGSPRYLVVDYKTNRLAPAGEELAAWHYRPAALVPAMVVAHYPLQLLLYLVALHRFLRWRQPGYDPDVHLGGGLYLFVRGMCGPDTPLVDGQPCGVAAWRPPSSLVVAASALVDRGPASGQGGPA